MKKWGNEKMETHVLNLAGKTSGLVVLRARPWSIVDQVHSGLERQERAYAIWQGGMYVVLSMFWDRHYLRLRAQRV